jgi:predicted acylesterase/phospholipase RssA
MINTYSYEHKRRVFGLGWAVDGSHLFSASFDGEIRAWHKETISVVREPHSSTERQVIHGADWWARQGCFITAEQEGLFLWDGGSLPKLIGEGIEAWNLKCSPTNAFIALHESIPTHDRRGSQRRIRIRALGNLSDVSLLDSDCDRADGWMAYDMAWAPNGDLLAVLHGPEVMIWKVGQRAVSVNTWVLGDWPRAIAWLTNNELAVTYGDGNIRVFDRLKIDAEEIHPKCKTMLEAHEAAVVSISVGVGSQQFATADADGCICIWNRSYTLLAKRTVDLPDVSGGFVMSGFTLSFNPQIPILAYAQGARVGLLPLGNEHTAKQAPAQPINEPSFFDKLLLISGLPRPKKFSDEIKELYSFEIGFETADEILQRTRQFRRIAQALHKIDLLLCDAIRQMWAAPTREEALALEDIELQAHGLGDHGKARNELYRLLANAFDNPDNRKRTIAICAYVLFWIGKYDVFGPLPEGKTVTDWLNSLNDEELRRQLKLLLTSKQSDGRSRQKPKAVADDLELTLTAIKNGLDRATANKPEERAQTILPEANKNYALVMKGGGLKGLAFIGALRELQPFYKFDLYVGTSAGAIIAALLGAGYTVDEMETILREMNFADFLSERFKTITNLLFHGGLFRGTELSNWIDMLLARELKSATRVKFRQLPYQVRIYSCRRDTDALIFDSKDSPDVSVAHAVRCSVAIPLFFTPERDQGLNVFDAGMRHNYPVKQLLEQTPDKKFIGLYLGDPIYLPRKPSIFRDLISISTEATDVEALEKYRSATIVIDPKPISTLDFVLSLEEKTFLLSQGRAAALVFLHANGYIKQGEVDDAVQAASQHKVAATAARRKRTFRRKLIISLPLIAIASYFLWKFATVAPISFAIEVSGRVYDAACKVLPICTKSQFQWVADNSESISHAIAADTAFIFPSLEVAPSRGPELSNRRYGEPGATCGPITQNAWKLHNGEIVLDDDPLIKNGWTSPSWVGEPEPPDWNRFDAMARDQFGWTPGFANNNRCPKGSRCMLSPSEIKAHSEAATVPMEECSRMRMVEKNYSNSRNSLTVWIRGKAGHESLWTVTAPVETYKALTPQN